MSNPIIENFKQFLNKEFTNNPSPVGAFLKGKLIHVEEGSLTMEYEVRKEMTNPAGILHGGMTSLIIDELIGATNYCLHSDYLYTSVNLNVDFLSAAKLGEKITATSKVIRKGKNMNHFECHLYNAKGKLLAKGSSNLIKTAFKIQDVVYK
jgi:acyl-coenzyme A thioesterase 13